MLIRMSGWSASAETPHLILGSGKRPDIRAKIGDKEVLFDVRTNTVTTAGYDSVARCAAIARYAAHTGAIKKHDDWGDPCFAMGYDFVALSLSHSHETGGHPTTRQLCLRAAQQQTGASPVTAVTIGSGSAALVG